jgi:hypothetical protein
VRVAFVALLVAAACAGVAAARDGGTEARRFEVLAHVDPGVEYSADVWGHRGHAYLSSHKGEQSCPASGVRVYDVRNPRRPRRVSTFGRIAGTWTEKTIVKRVATTAFTGDLAVASVQACKPQAGGFQGFALFDVTRPRSPRRLALVHTDPRGSHELWLAAARGKAWVYTAIIASEIRDSPDGRSPGRPDFRIFDVTNPRRPRQVGGWGAWRALGIHPSPTPRPVIDVGLVHSVITDEQARRAYLSHWDLGTVVLDISRPTRPRFLGRTGDTQNAHSAALGGSLLVETHETDGGTPTFFDVSNARRPRLLGRLELPESLLAEGRRERIGTVNGLSLADSVHDAKLAGETAYFSWYRQGIVAADVSDPAAPQVLARFLPPEARDREKLFCPGQACTAFWGVYAMPDGTVLASDMLGGLWVLRLR